MAAAHEGSQIEDALFEEALDFIKHVFHINELYHEQIQLIKSFCKGKNIFFNAPTGYGKSIVFQSLPWIYDMVYEQSIGFSTLIVISPLQSLMEDQCNRMKEIGISCICLYSKESLNSMAEYETILKDVKDGVYSLVYASPECMLGKNEWRRILYSEDFRDHCIGVAFDEAHIIAHWGSDVTGKKPFRKWYGELHEFRCLLAEEVKFALFTATATKQTKHKVFDMLNISESETFFIEKNPERENIRYCVEYVENDKDFEDIFHIITSELLEKKEMCSRRLIYTQTRKQCASIYNFFSSVLEDNIYMKDEQNPRFRLVEMFHGGTPESAKKHIVKQFANPDSCLRDPVVEDKD
ncbi:uncharacterized protein LOC114544809 [Dendronephthya gigantea]|uniref:uncharacterized protein LOC114544809 n=1 Tax=Dendronephthya gigantea TaxID=151771 RepID=UPI0010694229|nr:uncharacterized protein LOC114544809 [Dendronephthya gigantea]